MGIVPSQQPASAHPGPADVYSDGVTCPKPVRCEASTVHAHTPLSLSHTHIHTCTHKYRSRRPSSSTVGRWKTSVNAPHHCVPSNAHPSALNHTLIPLKSAHPHCTTHRWSWSVHVVIPPARLPRLPRLAHLRHGAVALLGQPCLVVQCLRLHRRLPRHARYVCVCVPRQPHATPHSHALEGTFKRLQHTRHHPPPPTRTHTHTHA